MKKAKTALIVLLTATAVFASLVTYCYVKAVVYAPKPPEGFYENGMFFDPSLEAWQAYTKAKNALSPHRIFLGSAWIGFTVLAVLWAVLGVVWFKGRKV